MYSARGKTTTSCGWTVIMEKSLIFGAFLMEIFVV